MQRPGDPEQAEWWNGLADDHRDERDRMFPPISALYLGAIVAKLAAFALERPDQDAEEEASVYPQPPTQ